MKKNIVVLGSTGSIGVNTLNIARNLKDKFNVIGITANKNIALFKSQIKEFNPEFVAVADEKTCEKLSKWINKNYSLKTKVYCGAEGVNKVAVSDNADMVVSAIVGSSGLIPTFNALQKGKIVALANKEVLVMAGELLKDFIRKGKIIPIDSEHCGMFQCLHQNDRTKVNKLIITASGGPFLQKKNLKKVTLSEALNHPTWNMGKKISIDSATLINKGFEVIEARWLFDVPVSKIEVLIHPQSVVHSMVEYIDGSVIAQMSITDMRVPIQYALTYPVRTKTSLSSLKLTNFDKLTFELPDMKRFPCLKYAYEACSTGGTMPVVLNAVNEVAVNAFINNRIKFVDIAKLIKKIMGYHKPKFNFNIESVLEIDGWARKKALNLIERKL